MSTQHNPDQEQTLLDAVDKPVQYGGFWRRAAAHLIDALILVPVVIVLVLIGHGVETLFLPLLVAQGCIGIAYQLYLTTRYGATFGKKAMKLRIVKIDGSAITFKEANLRYLPYALFALVTVLGNIVAFNHLPVPSIFFDASFAQRNLMLQQHQPFWAVLASLLAIIFALIDLLTLLFHGKKRSLHDQIGETMVIKLPSESA